MVLFGRLYGIKRCSCGHSQFRNIIRPWESLPTIKVQPVSLVNWDEPLITRNPVCLVYTLSILFQSSIFLKFKISQPTVFSSRFQDRIFPSNFFFVLLFVFSFFFFSLTGDDDTKNIPYISYTHNL